MKKVGRKVDLAHIRAQASNNRKWAHTMETWNYTRAHTKSLLSPQQSSKFIIDYVTLGECVTRCDVIKCTVLCIFKSHWFCHSINSETETNYTQNVRCLRVFFFPYKINSKRSIIYYRLTLIIFKRKIGKIKRPAEVSCKKWNPFEQKTKKKTYQKFDGKNTWTNQSGRRACVCALSTSNPNKDKKMPYTRHHHSKLVKVCMNAPNR